MAKQLSHATLNTLLEERNAGYSLENLNLKGLDLRGLKITSVDGSCFDNTTNFSRTDLTNTDMSKMTKITDSATPTETATAVDAHLSAQGDDLAQAKAKLITDLNLVPSTLDQPIWALLANDRGREISRGHEYLVNIGNVTKVDINGNPTTGSSNKIRYEILSQNDINEAKSSFDSLTNEEIDELLVKLNSRHLADISEGEVLYIKDWNGETATLLDNNTYPIVPWKLFVVATNELSSDGTYGTITFFEDYTDDRVTAIHSHYLVEEKINYSGVNEGVYKERDILPQRNIFINLEKEKIQNAKSIKELDIIELDFFKKYGINRNMLSNKKKLYLELNNENINSIIDYQVGSYSYLSDNLGKVESDSSGGGISAPGCVIS